MEPEIKEAKDLSKVCELKASKGDSNPFEAVTAQSEQLIQDKQLENYLKQQFQFKKQHFQTLVSGKSQLKIQEPSKEFNFLAFFIASKAGCGESKEKKLLEYLTIDFQQYVQFITKNERILQQLLTNFRVIDKQYKRAMLEDKVSGINYNILTNDAIAEKEAFRREVPVDFSTDPIDSSFLSKITKEERKTEKIKVAFNKTDFLPNTFREFFFQYDRSQTFDDIKIQIQKENQLRQIFFDLYDDKFQKLDSQQNIAHYVQQNYTQKLLVKLNFQSIRVKLNYPFNFTQIYEPLNEIKNVVQDIKNHLQTNKEIQLFIENQNLENLIDNPIIYYGPEIQVKVQIYIKLQIKMVDFGVI